MPIIKRLTRIIAFTNKYRSNTEEISHVNKISPKLDLIILLFLLSA